MVPCKWHLNGESFQTKCNMIGLRKRSTLSDLTWVYYQASCISMFYDFQHLSLQATKEHVDKQVNFYQCFVAPPRSFHIGILYRNFGYP